MIELRNISKRYGRIIAIDNLSLKIIDNERLVILGPSGCGKTTLLRLIAGFEELDTGEIFIDGKIANNPQIRISPQKRNIGMVFQDLALWPHMNVRENIGFGLGSVIEDRQKRQEEIEAILKMVHLQEKKTCYPSKLSGGEQQRVALARALIRKPEILLMDEPIVNLDFQLKSEMINLILDLQRSFSISLIYVTHDNSVVKQLADRVVLMRQGKIEQVQNKDEVFR